MIVLGIDAAWTVTQPSGVALVRRDGTRWRCLALAPSYDAFVRSAHIDARAIETRAGVDARARTGGAPAGFVDWRARPPGGAPNCDALIAACIAIAGAPPDAIAIDMPLAKQPIVARRAADNSISSAFGRFGLGAHSPNPDRPGPIAEQMRRGFEAHGYELAVAPSPATTRARGAADMPARLAVRPPRAMLEVFPHAALVALLGADYRVPYKLARAAQYWPEHSVEQRRRSIVAKWSRIRREIAMHIDGVALRVPRAGPLAALKRYEDALDAVVCSWAGIEFLEGRAQPYGDASAAVWATPVVKRGA